MVLIVSVLGRRQVRHIARPFRFWAPDVRRNACGAADLGLAIAASCALNLAATDLQRAVGPIGRIADGSPGPGSETPIR